MSSERSVQPSRAGDFAERGEHFRIDQTVQEGLALFRPVLTQCIDGALEAFYEHALSNPETASIIGSRDRIPELKKKQGGHWDLLFSGKFDKAYEQSANVVARVHSRIGLRPLWYMGGYNLVQEHLFNSAVDTFRKRPQDLKKVLRAINTVVLLDINLVLRVYQDDIKRRGEAALAESSDRFDESVGANLENAARTIVEIKKMADDLAGIAASTQEKCVTVATATEQASANVETVASASEELNASIQEIARQVQGAATLSNEAVAVSESSNQELSKLEEASANIGEVTKIIVDIASQTNLLALNATIEAARAGEAGKGFAVVANEVKSLSNRTEQATKEIEDQISEIRSATVGSIEAIKVIADKINQINESISAVATASEQQTAATTEISRSVVEASAGTQDVAKNMETVKADASTTGQASIKVSARLSDLQTQAEELMNLSREFTEGIRATRIE